MNNGNEHDDFKDLESFEHEESGLLNAEIIRQVATMISMGMRWYQAGEVCGINSYTFHGWRQRGQEDLKNGRNTLHAQFYGAIKKAQHQGILNSLSNLQNLMRGQTIIERHVKIKPTGETIEEKMVTKQTQPHLGAIKFYLQNRDPGNWNHDKEYMLQVSEGDDWKTKLEEFSGLDGMDFISEFVAQHAPNVIEQIGEIVGDEDEQ